ncbi:MAG TPA: 4Fe-4S binding protein [Armatimonadota bacterium]|nr:4Fe-4S binding protein [Armatimonadota bacterium]
MSGSREGDKRATRVGRRKPSTKGPLVGIKGGMSDFNDASECRLSLRLRAPEGMLSADQLMVLGDVVRRHGIGFVRIVGRSGLEVPGIACEEIQTAKALLEASGLGTASEGGAGSSLSVCSGQGRCVSYFVDAGTLAMALSGLLESEAMPMPVRVAISGCAEACSCPQTADIGFVGIVEPILVRAECLGDGACVGACKEGALIMRRGLPRRDPQRCNFCGDCVAACGFNALRPARVGYTVYVGGKAGRRPCLGAELARFVPEEDAPEVAARVIGFVSERARPRETFGAVLRRIGLDALRSYAITRPSQRTRPQEMTP